MTLDENVPLSSLTTFKIGGNARYVATCKNSDDIKTALALSREGGLPWYVIGGGSNILASDDGYAGVIIRIVMKGFSFDSISTDEDGKKVVHVTAEAGVVWDELVEESASRGLWGLENLAGIPGLVGGAPVQNIGAYGADVSETILFVDTFNTATEETQRFTKEECGFAYRDSRFKKDPSLIILRVVFQLQKESMPRTNYPDLNKLITEGEELTTSVSIAHAVREIRAKKFPDLHKEGTAGSFFKNVVIPTKHFEELVSKYPELPGFKVNDTGRFTKIPLAWILDHVLHLKGHTQGLVRLFENQPIVLVAKDGATSHDVDALARHVEQLVLEATGITLEREVRMLNASITTNTK
jgi:UDP-N-acetylmuramate dehydrogenase